MDRLEDGQIVAVGVGEPPVSSKILDVFATIFVVKPRSTESPG